MDVQGNKITYDAVLNGVSRLMGKRITPQGNLDDWADYIQEAFNYAWRYYKWDWSLKVYSIDLSNDDFMNDDFDIGGYREAIATADGQIEEVSLLDFTRMANGSRKFALQYDNENLRYIVKATPDVQQFDILYQLAPLTLNQKNVDGTYKPVPFPSAMTIAMGAVIYAKQGENPTRADISQEWDEFHAELDRHVGRVEKNAPRLLNLNIQDYYGTYTGDTRI